MKRKYLGIWLACLIWGCTACASNVSEKETQSVNESICETNDSDEEMNQGLSLEVYYVSDDLDSRKLIEHYKDLFPEQTLDLTRFTSVEEMDTRVAAEITAGKGPDVVLIPHMTTLDTHKIALNDVFLDLQPMLEADNSYNVGNYYDLMDAGIVAGKQMMLPLRFRCQSLMTSVEKMKDHGVYADKYTASELMTYISDRIDACEEDSCAMTVHQTGGVFLYDQLRLNNVELVDWEKESLMVADNIFEEYAVFAEKSYSEYDKSKDIRKAYGDDYLGSFDKWTFTMTEVSLPFMMRTNAAYVTNAVNQTPCLVTLPNYEDCDSISADISLYAVILANTKLPDEAYEFVRVLMDMGLGTFTNDLPINKAGMQELLDDLCKYQGKTVNLGSITVKITQMTPEQRAECEALLECIGHGSIRNHALESIITETMEPYIMGEADFDSCFTKFKNQVEIYLYE